MLVETTSLVPASISCATSGSSHAKNAVEFPMSTVHPADPSARQSSSIVDTIASGSRS
jgi:hypothetical protein